jgi:plasmid stabilization system protein ParE
VSLALQQSDFFWADLAKQVDWYRDRASPEVAARFVDAVEQTLNKLTKTPGIGRLRFVGWPELEGMHSFRVQRLFTTSSRNV